MFQFDALNGCELYYKYIKNKWYDKWKKSQNLNDDNKMKFSLMKLDYH